MTAKVTSITTERARRKRLPWSFTVDLAASRFVMRVRPGITAVDVAAMAEALELWGHTLLEAAGQLRRDPGSVPAALVRRRRTKRGPERP